MASKKLSIPKSTHDIAGYGPLLDDIRSIIDKGLSRAYQAVDNIKVQTYWQVGERIFREKIKQKNRADYGKQIIEKLTNDLSFSRSLLFQILQFYRTYPIIQTVSGQLSWSHYAEFIKITQKEERQYYEIQTISNSWSIRELRAKIKRDEYSKQKIAGKIDLTLPSTLPSPQEIFKNTYDWDFVELEE